MPGFQPSFNNLESSNPTLTGWAELYWAYEPSSAYFIHIACWFKSNLFFLIYQINISFSANKPFINPIINS